MSTSYPKFLSKRRIYIAIAIGLFISTYLLINEIGKSGFSEKIIQVNWTFKAIVYLGCALLMMVLRDFAYMCRLRVLTAKKLTWKQSLKVILMWEFASTVTPGVVGGSAIAMFILKKEKIPLGESTTLVLITALFDNIFYITYIPFIVYYIGIGKMFPEKLESIGASLFWTGYGIIGLITFVLSVSLFVYPQLVKHLLSLITLLPFLSKKRERAHQLGDDIITTSRDIKRKPFQYWFKVWLTTITSWTARFLVVNFLLLAFVNLDIFENVIVFGRQLVMWMVLLVGPTPGGSGLAEYLFSTFLGDFASSGTLIVVLAILWRMISYYPYLIIGLLVFPSWIKSK